MNRMVIIVIMITAKGSPSRTDSPDTGEVARSARRGALRRKAVRGGYFSHERHESHPSVTFGDSSPQREPFILPLMIHAVLFLVMGGAGQVQP